MIRWWPETCAVFLCHPLGDYHQSAQIAVALAGGQGDQLVAVLGGGFDLIQAQRFALGNKFIKNIGVLGVVKQMIGKAFAVGAGCLEHGDNLVGVAFVQGVKLDIFVAFVEILFLVLVQMAEHRAVEHVVAVNGHIVRGLEYIAGGPDIQASFVGIFVIEAGVQIIVRVLGGFHHGVVDIGALDGDPAYQVVIQFVNGLQLLQNGRIAGGAVGGGGVHGGQLAKELLALEGVNAVADQQNGADDENGTEQGHHDPVNELAECLLRNELLPNDAVILNLIDDKIVVSR